MDRDLIAVKLESLRHCVARVREKCPGEVAVLQSDPDRQDIVVLNLSRAVQLCVDICAHLLSATDAGVPETMMQSIIESQQMGFISTDTASALGKAIGFRNIAVHQYTALDWGVVHSVCEKKLDSFESFAREIMASVQLD